MRGPDTRVLAGQAPPGVLAPPIPQRGPSAARAGGRLPRHPRREASHHGSAE